MRETSWHSLSVKVLDSKTGELLAFARVVPPFYDKYGRYLNSYKAPQDYLLAPQIESVQPKVEISNIFIDPLVKKKDRVMIFHLLLINILKSLLVGQSQNQSLAEWQNYSRMVQVLMTETSFKLFKGHFGDDPELVEHFQLVMASNSDAAVVATELAGSAAKIRNVLGLPEDWMRELYGQLQQELIDLGVLFSPRPDFDHTTMGPGLMFNWHLYNQTIQHVWHLYIKKD